jgi:hypothetical protein
MWNWHFEGVPYIRDFECKNSTMAKICQGCGWQKDNDDPSKVTQLQYIDTSTSELLDYLCPRVKDFVTHNF